MTLIQFISQTLVISLFLSLSFVAQATDDALRFFSEIAAPYYFINEQGSAEGINVDLAAALAKELNIDASVEQLPWARAIQETLNKPNRILLSTLRTQKREKQFQWLGRLHQVRASLVASVASEHIHINTLEEAKQFRIGTIRGYGSADFLLNQGFVEDVNLVLVSNTARLWQMLNEKRIDMVVASLNTDRYEILGIGMEPDDFASKLAIPELDLELYVATGPKTDNHTTEKISKALEALKQRGELQAILKKWGVEQPKREKRPVTGLQCLWHPVNEFLVDSDFPPGFSTCRTSILS